MGNIESYDIFGENIAIVYPLKFLIGLDKYK